MHPLARLGPVRDAGLQIDFPHADVGRLEREPHPLLGFAQRMLRRLAIGDVFGDADILRRASRPHRHREAAIPHPADFSARPNDAVFVIERLAALLRLERADDARAIVVVDRVEK